MISLKSVEKYFHKIIIALNECDIILKQRPRCKVKGKKRKFTGVDGLYCESEKTITIKHNPKTVNLGLTLIHETLHHLRPNLSEKKVDLLSRELFCNFSTDQINMILNFLPN